MREQKMKTLIMLALGLSMSPMQNVLAVTQDAKNVKHEATQVKTTSESAKTAAVAKAISQEEMLKSLEQKLQPEPQLQKSLLVAIL